MKRRFRLTRSTDFQRVRRIGKTYAHPLLVLLSAPNELAQVRIGVVAGRGVGRAVRRNFARRRLRACLYSSLPHLTPGWDLVFLARKSIDQAVFTDICAAVHVVLHRAGLWND